MRFTIRDVLWLTVMIGLGVGWVVDHRAQVSIQEEFLKRYVTAVEPLGFEVERLSGSEFKVTVPPHRMTDLPTP
jgi:hypothetical protein